MTDIIQVALLIFGGLAVSYLALNQISDNQGVIAGFSEVYARIPEKFDMILSKDNPAYSDLPGVWVLIGGLWIAHFAYWGFNQYITQRALGAKSLPEASKRSNVCRIFKNTHASCCGFTWNIFTTNCASAAIIYPDLEKSDQAYPMMMSLLPNGILGLTFAALVAAIVSSLASMTNSSLSTIFTMDVYRNFASKKASEQKLVTIGRNVAWVSLVIAVFCAELQPLFCWEAWNQHFNTSKISQGFLHLEF